VQGQQRVLLVPLVRIHCLPPLRCVRLVPPLPMPPLFSAPLVPINQLQPVTQDIMDLLVPPPLTYGLRVKIP
jgi:hypothetical protein